MTNVLLDISGLCAFYGVSQVLFDVNLQCAEGQVTTLIGRNGMGKTTTVSSIIGLLKRHHGNITFAGSALHGLPAYQRAAKGIGLVPEGRQIFPNLTVKENLLVTAAKYSQRAEAWDLDKVLDFFPRLGQRLASMGNQLSGGEQQMLAIGRALMVNPALLILDEATEGLAPLIRQEIWQRLYTLKQSGLTILLIDKNIDEMLAIADQHYIIEKGQIVWQGDSNALRADDTLKQRYLSI